MVSRIFSLLSLLLIFSGCTQLQVGRTYLSQMEQDDSSFFNPRDDFPVVAGDTGRYWITDEERRARTPSSVEDQEFDLLSKSLNEELRDLEKRQSEESYDFYTAHKHHLTTVSERIYFLKLRSSERRDYLLSRGFIEEPRQQAFTPHERNFAVRANDILMGMRKEDVLESWGKPLKVEVAGNPRNENERWLYKMNGASKYIYFESGQVQGWE